jgi:hypothetical protein
LNSLQADAERANEDQDVTWSIDRTPDPLHRVETRVSAHRPRVEYDLIEEVWQSTPLPLHRPVLTRSVPRGVAENAQLLLDGNWIPAYRHDYLYHQLIPQVDPIKMKLIVSNNEKNDKTFDCPICLDCFDEGNSVKLNCDHVFCGECIGEVIRTKPHDITCALCRTKVSHFEVCSNDACEKLKTYTDRIEIC